MERYIWKYHGCLAGLFVEEVGQVFHHVGRIENHFTIADTFIDGHFVAKHIRYDIKGIYIPPMIVNNALDQFDFLGLHVGDTSYIHILERAPVAQIAALSMYKYHGFLLPFRIRELQNTNHTF